MSPLAQSLSDADIQNLATYYAGLTCKRGRASDGPRATLAAGKALAKNCAACHGETGIAGNPALAAARRPEARLSGERAQGVPGGPAQGPDDGRRGQGLSDTDIANLAAYYAAQSCQAGQEGRTEP